MTKYYYAFIGQKATTGNPNPKTGRMSMYGQILKFTDRKLRNQYVDNYYNQNNPSEYAVKCNKQTARQYCLGMSVHDYNDYLDLCPTGFFNDETKSVDFY